MRTAIDIYVRHSYGDAPLPAAVAHVVDQLNSSHDFDFYDLRVWDRDGLQPPGRLSLRLGCRFYAHMKLTLERRPDGLGYVFHVDPHDRHVMAHLGAWDQQTFAEVVRHDENIAAEIEAEWIANGVPTARKFLQASLPHLGTS